MDKATILIPDISGFTEFLSQTEIEHSAHIINELLEIIIKANELDFFLSEVEGDAVLFYKKGAPPSREALLGQCLKMFEQFHYQLKIISRDTVCKCGACQMTSNLNLKFIIHAGEIFEYQIAHFVKAAGIDMIIAHRLLKNQVPGDEYILLSKGYLDQTQETQLAFPLQWEETFDHYASIGNVPYQFTLLGAYRQQLASPPPRENPAFDDIQPNDQTLEVEIKAPMLNVYQTLVNVEKRILWVNGMKKMDRDATTERLGMKHICFTNGLRLEHTIVKTEFEEKEIKYYEKVRILELLVEVFDLYQIQKIDEQTSKLLLTISLKKNFLIPRFIFNSIVKGLKNDLNSLKEVCEKEFVLAIH